MKDNLNEQQGSIPTGSIRWDFSWPGSAREERHDLLLYLGHRFGINNSVFDDYLLLKKNKSWWLLRRSGFIDQAASLKVWMAGLKAFQKVGRYIKPTTRFIQVFGHHAVRAVLDVSEGDLKKMAQGEHISSDMDTDNGYIILFFKNVVLGLGLIIDGRVTSQLPKRDLILIA